MPQQPIGSSSLFSIIFLKLFFSHSALGPVRVADLNQVGFSVVLWFVLAFQPLYVIGPKSGDEAFAVLNQVSRQVRITGLALFECVALIKA